MFYQYDKKIQNKQVTHQTKSQIYFTGKTFSVSKFTLNKIWFPHQKKPQKLRLFITETAILLLIDLLV